MRKYGLAPPWPYYHMAQVFLICGTHAARWRPCPAQTTFMDGWFLICSRMAPPPPVALAACGLGLPTPVA